MGRGGRHIPDSRSPSVVWALTCRPMLKCRSEGSDKGRVSPAYLGAGWKWGQRRLPGGEDA